MIAENVFMTLQNPPYLSYYKLDVINYGRQPSYYLDSQSETALRQLQEGSAVNGLRKIKSRHYGKVSSGKSFINSNRPMITKSYIRDIISEGNLEALEEIVLNGQGDRLLGETSTISNIQSFLNIVPMYMERIYDVHRAVMRDQLEHVVSLLENKKLAMARDQLGATPLLKAVLFGHYKIAHYISHQFPETLNIIDTEGRTPLHYAAALKDNKNMYLILIEAGANKGLFDTKGKTADYYAQYPEHLNLEEVIKRCHKVNANYLANTASRIKGKSPVRQTPPPSHANHSSPRSDKYNSKENSQSNESSQENELVSLLQIDKCSKRLDVTTANIERWIHAKDIDKLAKAVIEGYGDKVLNAYPNENSEDGIRMKLTELVKRIHAIHSAVSSNNTTELQSYLEDKDFVLAKDKMGNTPLHKSVLLQKTKIVKFLIEKFPEAINIKNKNGLTALHYAAAMFRKDGHQMYKMLLQAGANRKVKDNHGRNPDYYKTHLITLPNKEMTRSRSQGSRHLDALNPFTKQNVLERMTAALQQGDVELIHDLVLEGHGKYLIGKTSWNENVRSFLKELPSYLSTIHAFHETVRSDDVQKAKAMVSYNVKLLSARDATGALPIHIASSASSLEVLQYLLADHPIAINGKDSMGRTALHIASLQGNQILYKMLKDAGVDPKITDQKGKTADFYFQNTREKESHAENDSSKSSGNSISDSIQCKVNKKQVSRKKSKRFLKATMVNNKKIEAKLNSAKHSMIVKNASLEDHFDSSEFINTEQGNNATVIDECHCTDVSKANLEENEKYIQDNDKISECEVMNFDQNRSEETEVDFETDQTLQLEDFEKSRFKEEYITIETENDLLNNEAKDLMHTDENTEYHEHICNTNDADIVIDHSQVLIEEEIEVRKNENSSHNDSLMLNEENVIENNTTKIKHSNASKSLITFKATTMSDVQSVNHLALDNVDTIISNEDNISLENNVKMESDENKSNDMTNENIKDRLLKKEKMKYDIKHKEFANEEMAGSEATNYDLTNNEMKNYNVTNDKVGQDKEIEDELTYDKTSNEEIRDELLNEETKDELENGEILNKVKTKDIINELMNDEVMNLGITNKEVAKEALINEEVMNEQVANREDSKEELMNKYVTNEEILNKEVINEVPNEEVANEDVTNEVANEDVTNDKILNEEMSEELRIEKDTSDGIRNEERKGYNLGAEDGETQDDSNINDIPEKVSIENMTKENASNCDGQFTLIQNDESINSDIENICSEENTALKTLSREENLGTVEDKDTSNNEMVIEKTDCTLENTSDHWSTKKNIIEEKSNQIKDHLDELIEHWIDEGDLLRLEHVVLAGQGDRLIERTSEDKQVQDFLDLVPIYMAKIRAVHEAVVKGLLREVRSVLTRKRFALSRDHVGASPLHLAILYGHTDVSTYIVSHFPETIDGPDNEGRTPLHYATALRDNGALYKLLRAAGADENIEDKSGHSAKYYMSHPGKLILEKLLEPYSVAE